MGIYYQWESINCLIIILMIIRRIDTYKKFLTF